MLNNLLPELVQSIYYGFSYKEIIKHVAFFEYD